MVVLLAQHVPPAAVQEAVQDVRGDDVRQGERLLRLEARLQAQRGPGEHGAHGGVEGAGVRGGAAAKELPGEQEVKKVLLEWKVHSEENELSGSW